MDYVFDLCVAALVGLADLFGTTYKAINVWIFVILWPILTVVLIVILLLQRRRIRALESRLQQGA